MRSTFALVCSLGLLAGCAKEEPPPKAAPVAAAAIVNPPYNTNIPISEVMVHVMNPAGYQFWSGWGVIEDQHGTRDLAPKTEAEWMIVENGAATVVQTTNAIMVPGYARDPTAEWNRLAQNVANIALRGKEAAEKHDKAVLGDIGEQLDVACDACHAKFPPVQDLAIKQTQEGKP